MHDEFPWQCPMRLYILCVAMGSFEPMPYSYVSRWMGSLKLHSRSGVVIWRLILLLAHLSLRLFFSQSGSRSMKRRGAGTTMLSERTGVPSWTRGGRQVSGLTGREMPPLRCAVIRATFSCNLSRNIVALQVSPARLSTSFPGPFRVWWGRRPWERGCQALSVGFERRACSRAKVAPINVARITTVSSGNNRAVYTRENKPRLM